MNKEKPLYLSIDPQLYKNSKAGLLNSQIDLLNSMKHIHNLQEIKAEKMNHKMKLYSLMSSLPEHLSQIEQKLPKVQMEKEKVIQNLKPQSDMPIEKPKKPSAVKMQGIDDELRSIQEKLKRLNS